MDIEKLIERLTQYSQSLIAYKLGADFADACMDAATALSKLQAENEKLRGELEQVRRERDAAQSLLAERIGVRGAEPITTAFGLPIDRLRELAQAELEGRIMLRSAGSGKKCGSCVHWHRISETKRGTCDVRQWERNRRGHMEPWRHSFTPAQSYGACRHYIPGEDSANG